MLVPAPKSQAFNRPRPSNRESHAVLHVPVGIPRAPLGPPTPAVDTTTIPQPSASTITPADASITLADRWELLTNLTPGPMATALKHRLQANDPAGFDQILLDRMAARQGPAYFFAPADVPQYVQFAATDPTVSGPENLGQQAATEAMYADKILQHLFPQQVDSAEYTVQLGTTIDWDAAPDGQGSNFLHALNRHNYWPQLAVAYRMTGDRRYARELCAQLETWYAQNPALKNPDAWPDTSPRWWLLDAADRVTQWTRTYYLMLGSKGLTPEANTLFLSGLLRHADFLSRVTPRSTASNWTTLHAAALSELGLLFPEFTRAADWRTQGRQLMNACLDRQFYPDGGHVEESPSYGASALGAMLADFRLDMLNGGTGWTRKARLRLQAAVEALYQMAISNRQLPALSDTYARFPIGGLLSRAGVILGDRRYITDESTLDDLWMFGPDSVTARRQQGLSAGLPDRGPAFAMPDAGYYVLPGKERSDGVAETSVIFDAGPTGGSHGHYDLFNIELDDNQSPSIADPGPWAYDDSPQRAFAVSTPAHNTISIDGENHMAVAATHSPLISIDKVEVTDVHALITARHYAYADLPGQPVVARSIWLDRTTVSNSPLIIVDWVSSSANHTYTSSLTVPTDASRFKIRPDGALADQDGAPVIQPLVTDGRTVTVARAFTTTSPPPAAPNQATRWSISQTGKSALFVTLVVRGASVDYDSPTATLVEPPRRGRPLQIRLHVPSQIDRIIAFDPPDLNPLPTPITASAAPIPPTPFSITPIRANPALTKSSLLLEPARDADYTVDVAAAL
jgi:hypothetical protein